MSLAFTKDTQEGLPVYQSYQKTVILSLSVAGAALALALFPYSRDYFNYELIFENASGAQNLVESFSAAEPIFSGLCYLTSSLFFSVFILVCLGLLVKLKYFASLGEAAWISAIIYFAHFFIVHDVTQIRASFAIALLPLGYLLLEKRRYLLSVLILCVSPLAHISALIYIPIVCFAALARRPQLVLQWAFVGLLGIVLLKLAGYVILGPSAWNIEAYLPENGRLLDYLLANDVPDVKGLGREMFLYFKLVALGAVAFSTQTCQVQASQDPQSDWPIRAALIVTFASVLYVVFYDSFTIGARLSDLSAPFECAVMAAFVLLVSKPFYDLGGAAGTLLVRIALTLVLVVLLMGPQLLLLESNL